MGVNWETVLIGFIFGLGFWIADVIVNAIVNLIKK